MGSMQTVVVRTLVAFALAGSISLASGCARVAPSQLESPVSTAAGSASPSPGVGVSGSGSAATSAAAPSSGAVSATFPASSGSASASSSGAGAENVSLTAELQHEILVAAAAFNKLPVTAYSGLMPTLTYLARDSAGDLWVGTSLEPSSTSIPAQVSVQDNGSYLLLRQRGGTGTWTVWAVGLSTPQDCATIGLPLAVSSLWGWEPSSCRPGPTA